MSRPDHAAAQQHLESGAPEKMKEIKESAALVVYFQFLCFSGVIFSFCVTDHRVASTQQEI